jgi:hypothetical protein
MQYMLLICYDETFTPAEELEPETVAWVEEMDGRNVRISGDRLRPPSDATTLRMRDDEVLLTDGPFAETKEQMAGYDLIECEDLDEAIEVASKHPMARLGSIEIRPVWTS